MGSISIKTAKAGDKDRTVGTVVSAFSADPAARGLYPDSQQYFNSFPGFIRAFDSNFARLKRVGPAK